MPYILLVSMRQEGLSPLKETLSSDPEFRLKHVGSGVDALRTLHEFPPHLAVIDSSLPDMEPLDLIKKILMVNAMVNTAVMTSVDDKTFHDQTEGLGILTRLPLQPGRREAEQLLLKLRQVV